VTGTSTDDVPGSAPAGEPGEGPPRGGQPDDKQPDHGAPEPARRRRPKVVYAFGVVAVILFLIGAMGGSYQGKLSKVQKNDSAEYLPNSAESTKVDSASQRFRSVLTIPGFIVYQRNSGLTAADKAKITADATTFATLKGVAGDQVAAPTFATSGTTANISVPLIGKDNGVDVQGDQLAKNEKRVIAAARANAPPGLVVHSAGAGGLLVAFIDAFQGIDGALLLAAGVVVIMILLVVYRSPVLWFFPLFSAVLALGAASLVVYPLAKHNVLTLNGQSQGILSVLVIGAGTDYALLLISRYREELHNYESRIAAMTRAWRGAAPAIGASAITVILGLLCLTLGELNSDRSLGPVTAIGIACTAAIMLLFLPAFLVLFGRWVFWPRIPRVDHTADIATHGLWGRFSAALGRRKRVYWVVATLVLLAFASGIAGLRTGGLAVTDGFTNTPDAVAGQKIFDVNFNQGSGAPAIIIANAAKADQVIAAARTVPGVNRAPGGVCIEVDYAKAAKASAAGGGGSGRSSATGCPPAALRVNTVDGRTAIDANINYRYDTHQAYDTVRAIRTAVHRVDGADAIVGGQSAINFDTLDASRHDRNLIIPIVLLVILVVLGLLLRSLVAPVLLIATVVLSFAATLGVSAFVFNHIFHFKNADPAFPLFAFVFLVALGIDYNIFLMTRVREETQTYGTRDGVLRGLAVTGGVITSAGVVLAATFAVLGVLPLVFLAELGFAVAFGVLLDTVVVRSILVPALSYDLGKRIWLPSKLARGAD
jgi:RND superfamily putative drug exporter